MQLGARWRAGDAPHRGVPPTLYAAVSEQEALHPGASAWTLTWLEGRPRLALDDLVIVTVDAAGQVACEQQHGGARTAADSFAEPLDDDDDDWLS